MLDVQNTEESILNIVQDVLALDMVRIIRLFLLYLGNIFSQDIIFLILCQPVAQWYCGDMFLTWPHPPPRFFTRY